MRRAAATVVLMMSCLIHPCRADDEPKTDPLVTLKKNAAEHWAALEAGEHVFGESEHFLIVAPKAMQAKLKEHGELFEKHHDAALKALYGEKLKPLKSRITVYLLPQSVGIDTYIRRIEKRRPLGREKATFNHDDEKLRIAAVASSEKSDPPVEAQAAMEIGSLFLQRKAGPGTILPYWFLNGYGRAVFYRTMPNHALTKNDRVAAPRLMNQKKRSAKDIWDGTLEGDEAVILEAHLADFFAHGPARMKFLAFVEGFRPGENEDKKTFDQALTAVDLKADAVGKTFRTWIARPN